MREILFRGKALSSGMWVKGGYVKGPEISGGHSYIVRYLNGGVYWHRVDPATVGQYTGLMDKNGKRIFEGDVTYDGCTIERVWFKNGQWVTVNRLGYWAELYKYANHYEVIGNIHDNPELVKG